MPSEANAKRCRYAYACELFSRKRHGGTWPSVASMEGRDWRAFRGVTAGFEAEMFCKLSGAVWVTAVNKPDWSFTGDYLEGRIQLRRTNAVIRQKSGMSWTWSTSEMPQRPGKHQKKWHISSFPVWRGNWENYKSGITKWRSNEVKKLRRTEGAREILWNFILKNLWSPTTSWQAVVDVKTRSAAYFFCWVWAATVINGLDKNQMATAQLPPWNRFGEETEWSQVCSQFTASAMAKKVKVFDIFGILIKFCTHVKWRGSL